MGFALFLAHRLRPGTVAWSFVFILWPSVGQGQAPSQERPAATPREGPVPSPSQPAGESEREQGHEDWGHEDWGHEDWGETADDDAFSTLAAAVQDLEPPTPQTATDANAGQLSVGGALRHRSALWVERLSDLPWAQARSSLDVNLRYKRPLVLAGVELSYRIVADVHFEYDLAYQVDREQYDTETLSTYESQVIGGETFLSVSAGPVDVTVGRQIVVWGQGDLFSVVDIVNPRDLREPGLAELDDIRLAVLASRVGVFTGSHRLELMALHEANWGLRPAPLSPFSPLRRLLGEDPAVAALLADRSLAWTDEPNGIALDDRTQWLARWQYNGAGLDLSLHAAYTRERQGVLALQGLTTLDPTSDTLPIPLEHPAYVMLGHAGAAPLGEFIIKWEAVVDVNRPITARGDGPLDIAGMRRTQLGWLLGITYSGIPDGTLSVEYAGRFLPAHPKRRGDDGRSILFPVEAPSLGLLFRQTYLRERLSLNATLIGFGLAPVLGVMGRAEVTYSLGDGLSAGIGAATYHPNRNRFGPLFGFDRNDRLYGTLRYDFLLD